MLGCAALWLLLSLALPAPAGAAEGDPCAALTPAQRAVAEAVYAAVYPHDCCDETLQACLAAPQPARLVRRLAADVCRQAADGRQEADIRAALERRGASMVAVGAPAAIDLTGLPPAGAADAPVTVVVYACARCPFCAKALPQLHADVTTGPLQGKVKLAFKGFPVRGHAHATEGALALEAARALGAFWPYLLRLYGDFDGFSLERLTVWARESGIDPVDFEARMQDEATRAAVVGSKKEGLRLGVEATPTLFIDGRRYRGDLDPAGLRDALLEAFERARETVCQPAP
jgi:protein-disulfide isomerase